MRDFELGGATRDLLEDVAKRLRGTVGFEEDHVTVAAYRRLAERVRDGVELVPAPGLVEQLRAVKDETEIAAMAAAADIGTAAYESLRERGLAGRAERDVSLELVRFMEDQGSEPPCFSADRGERRVRRPPACGAARRGDTARHARGDRPRRARGRLLL